MNKIVKVKTKHYKYNDGSVRTERIITTNKVIISFITSVYSYGTHYMCMYTRLDDYRWETLWSTKNKLLVNEFIASTIKLINL